MARGRSAGPDGPIVLKKYGNRRIYDTSKSKYITLEDAARMVREGVEFTVVDAKTGEDLTRLVLLQIIIEHQKGRVDILPIPFLRQLISYREEVLREFFDRYLGMSLEMFASAEEQFARRFRDGFESFLKGIPAAPMNPFTSFFGGSAPPQPPPRQEGPSADELQRRIDELERKLAGAAKPSRKRR